MRALMTFDCEGDSLAATLDSPAERSAGTGLLMVMGGSQTRTGSHRMYEELALRLAGQGFPCFRYDRRGVGDSEGVDRGYRESAPDLIAAASAFRASSPHVERMIGFGLCDGASTLMLFADEAGMDGIILANPWIVETGNDGPAPAAIRSHYRKRLFSSQGWKRFLSGSIDYRKAMKGLAKILKPSTGGDLADRIATAMNRHRLPAALILAESDATAIAAQAAFRSRAFRGRIAHRRTIASDSHTFARPDDDQALESAVVEALRSMR